MTGLCERLRVATRREHTALDRALLASGAFRDVDRYARFLRRMAGFHGDVERRLAGHPLTTASGHHARSGAAVADLRRLAELGSESTVDPVDPPGFSSTDRDAETGSSADPAEIVGVLYVVEGSSLGGVHLARLVRRHLPEVGDAVSFLDGVGDATQARWERTVAVIDASGADPRVATAAARDTFRMAGAWLDVSVDAVATDAGADDLGVEVVR